MAKITATSAKYDQNMQLLRDRVLVRDTTQGWQNPRYAGIRFIFCTIFTCMPSIDLDSSHNFVKVHLPNLDGSDDQDLVVGE